MNKKEFFFISELKRHFGDREIYCDTPNLVANCTLYCKGNKLEYFFDADKQKCIDGYFQKQLEMYGKNNPFHKRLRDELHDGEEKYKAQYGEFWEKIHQHRLVQELPRKNAAILFVEQKVPDEYITDENIVVMKEKEKASLGYKLFIVERNKDTFYYSCNRKIDIRKIDREYREELNPIPYDILEVDFMPSKDDKVKLVYLDAQQCLYFRRLKTHNFVGTAQSSGLGLLINNKLAGVFGYDTAYSTFYDTTGKHQHDLFLQFCIGVSNVNRKVKMSKLLNTIALWEKAAKYLLNDYQREIYTNVASTCISKYPENKAVRFLMDLITREYDEETKMYRLVYMSKMTNQESLEEIYGDWLRKEGII